MEYFVRIQWSRIIYKLWMLFAIHPQRVKSAKRKNESIILSFLFLVWHVAEINMNFFLSPNEGIQMKKINCQDFESWFFPRCITIYPSSFNPVVWPCVLLTIFKYEPATCFETQKEWIAQGFLFVLFWGFFFFFLWEGCKRQNDSHAYQGWQGMSLVSVPTGTNG